MQILGLEPRYCIQTGGSGFATCFPPLDICPPLDYNGAMMLDNTYEKIAKKITDLFADGRLTYADWNYIALFVVTRGREDYLLDRIEHFANSLVEYRNQIQFGDNGYEQDKLF